MKKKPAKKAAKKVMKKSKAPSMKKMMSYEDMQQRGYKGRGGR
jgi:hypothetical protein